MKHGKGTELPGMTHSQGARIGVIYVSPDDDRRTVLTAILAEEKLKREKIVLDLPQKNKAFQRPEDFDDLKMLRRNKLQAELIFVTPPGPGPADFARQRRFAVFSTMDSFVRSFTTGSKSPSGQSASSQLNKAGKKGLFSGAKKVAPSAAAGAAGFIAGEAIGKAGLPGAGGTPPIQRRRPGLTPASDVPDRPTQPVPPKAAQPSRSAPLPPPETEDEDEDLGFLPPSIMPPDPRDQPDKETTTTNDIPYTPSTGQGADLSPNIDKDDDWVPPLEEQSIPANLPDTPPATGAGIAGMRAASTSGPRAIELSAPKGTTPRGTGKTTKILPPSAMADAPTQEPPSPIPAARPSTRPNRNTGKMAATGAAGAVAGAMAVDALARPTTDTANTTTTSTTTTNTGQTPAVSPRNAGASRTPQPKRGRTVLIAAIVIVILLMLCSVTAVANPGGVRDNVIRAFSGNAAPPATITITPVSQTVQDTFVMSGINGNTNAGNRQISVRPLSSTQKVTKQVPLTSFHQDAQLATGTITFFNGSANTVKIASGTVFQVGNVQIITNKEAVVPPLTPPNTPGQVTVPAHAQQVGTIGNIPASAINGFCCGNASITAQNFQKFTGGADAVDYKYLKPDDVTKVVNDNQGTLKSSAQDDITKKQIQNSEQLLGDIKCDDPKTTTDIQPNDHIVDKNITAATVTVSVSCNAKVFDAKGAQTIAENLLTQKAMKDLGAGYVLAGHIATQPLQPQFQQDPITFSVNAQGVWSYNLTDANKQDLLNKIKGKIKAQAQAILNSYPGIANAKITLSNNDNTLPSDANQIDVKTVNSPSGGSGQTPIPTNSGNNPSLTIPSGS